MSRGIMFGAAAGALVATLAIAMIDRHMVTANPPASVVVPYNGATVGDKTPWSSDDVRRMLGYMKSIDERLGNIEAGPRAPGALTLLDPLKVATNNGLCVNCHTPTASETKGGGFILFANDEGSAFKPFSTREKAKIKDAVESGQMPPPARGKLSPNEKAAFQFGPAVTNREVQK